jgi:alginate O-acetyltransferase complex protein AlgI
MLFNSIEFFVFLPIVFFLYWFVFNKNTKIQNALILISSYIFYGWWDYRFLFLIFLSTIADYFIGLSIHKQTPVTRRKFLLWCSLLFNLSLLGFFKYYNFFISSWVDLMNSLGFEIKGLWTLQIILPVGISFYTFQTISYSIDIYKRRINPTRDFIAFASFVGFFPQLVAGPIERAKNLLPQILDKRRFKQEQGISGVRLIVWGMFKKVVIADSIAPYVNQIFSSYQDLSGGILWLGIFYFAFQLYCDFSGYSDIAIGVSKLFGFELKTNFNFPYFARNIGEFWRRWHISLTTWFRDYLAILLRGSKRNKWRSIRYIFSVFLLSGLWHGANWTFIVSGLYHAILFIPSLFFKINRKPKTANIAENTLLPSLKETIQVITTFVLVSITYVFFRSETIRDSFIYLNRMIFEIDFPTQYRSKILFYVVPFVICEFAIRKFPRLDFKYFSKFHLESYIISFLIILIILHFGREQIDFIYFQY